MAATFSTPGAQNLEALGVTSTAAQLNFSTGVTSAIQTQIDGKKKNWVAVPASASAAGTAGDIAYADGFLYVCVATNTWQRVIIATWA